MLNINYSAVELSIVSDNMKMLLFFFYGTQH